MRPDQVLIDYDLSKEAYSVTVFKERGIGGKDYTAQKIIFGTMTIADLAIIELEVSYRDLRNVGYRVYHVAKRFPEDGMYLKFSSYFENFDGICNVYGVVPTVVEGPYIWTKSLTRKFLSPENRL